MRRRTSTRLTLLVLAGFIVAGCGVPSASQGTVPASASDPNAATQGPATPSRAVRYAVEGVVTDAAGHPVAGVAVLPVSLDQPAHLVPELPIRSDAHGRYAWPSLAPGRYELRASAAAGSGSTLVTVQADRTAAADVTLRP